MLVDHPECPLVCPPSSPYSVEEWKQNVAICYTSISQLHDSQVTAITAYKNNDGCEHEYFVADCHRLGVDFHLRVERFPADPSDSLASREAEKNDPCKTTWLTVLHKLYHKFNKKKGVRDSVNQLDISKGPFGKDARKIAYYHDFQHPLYVRDLAFLSSMVHSYRPNYDLFRYQCYWYSRTITNVVISLYQPKDITYGEHYEEAGTYKIRKRWLNYSITVNEPCGNEVRGIQTDFEEALRIHDAEVQGKMNEQSRKLEELKQQIAQCQRRSEEIQRILRTSGSHD